MLGFLPRPFEDETLYSVLARYQALTGTMTSRAIKDAAFGRDVGCIRVLLPGRLRHFISAIPGKPWSLEEVITKHTMLPYLERFVHPDVRDRLRDTMAADHPLVSLRTMAAFLGSVRSHQAMNFCPACVASDQTKHRMSAWRRVHQLPGVFQCPWHGDRLRSTNLRVEDLNCFVTCPSDPRAGTALDTLLNGSTLASVARNSLWLLTNPGPTTDLAVLSAGVRRLLGQAGWTTGSGRVLPLLQQAVEGRLGSEALRSLNRDSGEGGKSSYRLRYIWSPRCSRHLHPLRYLSLLAFMDRHVEELFTPGDQGVRHGAAAANHVWGNVLQSDPAICTRLTESHKQRLSTAVAASSVQDRTLIWRKAGDSLRYLRAHDPDWLRERLPPRNTYKKCSRDWAKVDADLLPMVVSAITRLRAAEGLPKRITVTGIAREAGGSVARLLYKGCRLPLCWAAARDAAEDGLMIARRRLKWAANDPATRDLRLNWTRFSMLGQPCYLWPPEMRSDMLRLFEDVYNRR